MLGLHPSFHLPHRTVNAPSWSRSTNVNCAFPVPQCPHQVWMLPDPRFTRLSASRSKQGRFHKGDSGGHLCHPLRAGRKQNDSRMATPPCPGADTSRTTSFYTVPRGGPGTGKHPRVPEHRLSSEAAFQEEQTTVNSHKNPYDEGVRKRSITHTFCSYTQGGRGSSP